MNKPNSRRKAADEDVSRMGASVHGLVFALFTVQWGIACAAEASGHPRWFASGSADALLLLLGAAATVATLCRRLPAQNVLLASAIILLISAGVHGFGSMTGMPFGPYLYMREAGPELFRILPWAVPFLWLIALLNGRGVARLIVRPWRKTRNYGFWVIGIAVLLVVIFDLGLEPFAARVRRYWVWGPSHAGLYWYGAPWLNFVGWALTALLILAFATPSLINKKPVKQPVDFGPLWIWLMMQTFLIIPTLVHQLWASAALILVSAIVTAIFAIRGALW
ncbi:MAG TPA: carotenoid biosynthesis protein [Verrucomicrobiae bacterium]|nr:carotenoid biosynthesis protein [Verrucomicrobiae bacterium]